MKNDRSLRQYGVKGRQSLAGVWGQRPYKQEHTEIDFTLLGIACGGVGAAPLQTRAY